MKPQHILPIWLAFLLTACAPKATMLSPQTLAYEMPNGNFTFAAPDGYCLERASLREVAGAINPNTRFVEIIASNCKIENGIATPTKLQNIISISVAPATKPLAEEIAQARQISPIKIEKADLNGRDNAYWVKKSSKNCALVYNLGANLVHIELYAVAPPDPDALQTLLKLTFDAIETANKRQNEL